MRTTITSWGVRLTISCSLGALYGTPLIEITWKSLMWMWNGWLSFAWLMIVHSSTVPSRGSKTGLLGKSAPLMTNSGGIPGCGRLLKITVRDWATGWVRKSWNGLFGGVRVVGGGT